MTEPLSPGTRPVTIPGSAQPVLSQPAAAPSGPTWVSASIGHRFGSVCVGGLVLAVPYAVLVLLTYMLGFVGYLVGAALILAFAITQLVLLGTRGYTVEKRLTGLRVVDEATGRPVGVGRAFVRQLVLGLVAVFTCNLGVLVMAIVASNDPRKQGWHDKAAHTVVVRADSLRPVGAGAAAGVAGSTQPAAVAAAVAELATPAPRPVVLPPTPSSVPHVEPSGLISGVPGVPVSQPEPTRHEPMSAPVSVPPPVEGARIEHETRARPVVQRMTRLTLPDGTTHRLSHGVSLLGRNPAAQAGEVVAGLVAVTDSTMSVSKTHAEIESDGLQVWVADRHSTNGTRIEHAGTATQLEPGRRMTLPPGARLLLGDLAVLVDTVADPGESSPSTDGQHQP